jgi:hypothetical protein
MGAFRWAYVPFFFLARLQGRLAGADWRERLAGQDWQDDDVSEPEDTLFGGGNG